MAVLLPLAVCGCSGDRQGATACSAPRQHWQQPVNTNVIDFPKLDVAVDRRSTIYVEGKPASLSDLERQLQSLPRNEAPTMRVFLATEMGASCRVVDSVRDAFDRALDCRQPFRCNEGIRELWRVWPEAPGTPPS